MPTSQRTASRGSRRAIAVLHSVRGALLLAALAAWAPGAAPARPDGSASAAPAASGAAPTLQRLKAVLSTLSAAVARRRRAGGGFAARDGLDVEVVVGCSGAKAMAASISGDAPIGSIGGNALINAAAGGAELLMVAQQKTHFTYQIIAGPGASSPADLRGRAGVAESAARLRPGRAVHARQVWPPPRG